MLKVVTHEMATGERIDLCTEHAHVIDHMPYGGVYKGLHEGTCSVCRKLELRGLARSIARTYVGLAVEAEDDDDERFNGMNQWLVEHQVEKEDYPEPRIWPLSVSSEASVTYFSETDGGVLVTDDLDPEFRELYAFIPEEEGNPWQ